MRRALAFATLLASAGWVPVREAPLTSGPGYATRAEPRLLVARDVPAGWRGTIDRDTGVLAQLWGGSILVPGANGDAAIAERAARAFLRAHLSRLAPGASVDDL